MTIKGASAPACAACKYQRRRCTPDCLLAPYFPADQPQMFQNVHRLFGVANVAKTLSTLKDNQNKKDDAVTSIIFESNMREKSPIFGCVLAIYSIYVKYVYMCQEFREIESKLFALRGPKEYVDLIDGFKSIRQQMMPNFNQFTGLEAALDQFHASPNPNFQIENGEVSGDLWCLVSDMKGMRIDAAANNVEDQNCNAILDEFDSQSGSLKNEEIIEKKIGEEEGQSYPGSNQDFDRSSVDADPQKTDGDGEFNNAVDSCLINQFFVENIP
ncbi:protein LATERAL ORGAN BOUNDARIES-like isoform X2 [Andrographis paniculata]|uniref:protein LATERAL ORGAN BOUNDARIES-like isoform X2 n=1 Tax=Andrographis paniculata TaxID=175694 RepID=UPI0021E73B64|nr:protein LATERAL ORGAN BOUNDARIES-like isoform X2 [Andrographis paniculata]